MDIETIRTIGLYVVIPICAVLWAWILVRWSPDDHID